MAQAAEVHANDVVIDARTREAVLEGDVRIDAAPFFLRSDELRVRRDARGALVVDGDGRVAFCPCLGAPLAVGFSGATVAPPGDVLLRSPTLQVMGAPVLWLPYFWLRSPAKAGLLPPDIAYRGSDGMFLGDGIHLPWSSREDGYGLDVKAGGYFEGGVATEADLATASSRTRVLWDHLRSDGLTLDSRGAIGGGAGGEGTLAWDADAIRGARGVYATTDVDAAARPFDRLRGESAWSFADGWSFATALRSTAVRGGQLLDVGAAGPVASLRSAAALGGAGAYDATVEGGALAQPGKTMSFARGEAGTLLADRWGPVGSSLALRVAGDAAGDGESDSAQRSGADGAASARARLGLPLARTFEAEGAPNDPWVHRLEPSLEGAVIATHGDGLLGVAPGRGLSAVSGEAWVVNAGLASEQGRWGGRVGSDVSVWAGATGGFGSEPARLVALARASLTSRFAGLSAEAARVGVAHQSDEGGAFVGRARLGATDGVHLTLLAAERDGVDPVTARVLTDAPLEPSGGFLASTGWTGGARARIPWTSWLATTGGADGDLTTRVLVDARGGIELRDRCGCLVVSANAAHRIGREGVDAWLAVSIAAR